MTFSVRNLEAVEQHEGLLADRVRLVIGKRTGESVYSSSTELTALGVDSLLLLRIIADLVADLSFEIDPVRLADVMTVADLHKFLGNLGEGS